MSIAERIYDREDDLTKGPVLVDPYIVDHNVAVKEILDPSGIVPLGSTRTPMAIVVNLGRYDDTGIAYFEIANNEYSGSAVFTLEPGEEDTVSFGQQWEAIESAAYRTVCRVEVPGDQVTQDNSPVSYTHLRAHET